MALPQDIANYKIGVKNEVVDALRQVFLSDFPDPELANKVRITLEYPNEQVHFPAIMVGFQEIKIRLAGVGHREHTEDQIIAHWRFEGNIVFTVMTLSNLDRDLLSGALVNVIAFHHATEGNSRFYEEIFDSEFIDMQIGMDNVTPGGDQVENVPWDDPTRKLYTATYSVPIIGEFYALRESGVLVTISDVELFPYRPGQIPPIGSQDPRDINVPWSSDGEENI
jgi:hypothetical protein